MIPSKFSIGIGLSAAALSLLLWVGCGNASSDNAPTSDADSPRIAAIDNLLKAIEAAPNDATLFAQLGSTYVQYEGYDEAITSFQKAIALDSTQPAYFAALTDVYMRYNKSYDALLTAQRAVGQFPDSISALFNLADVQLKLKKYDPSIQTVKRILERQPTNDLAFFLLGQNYKYKGDTLQALKSFQTAVDFNADYLLAYQELALLCDAMGRDELAIQYFDNSIRIDSTDAITLFNRANFHRERLQDSEALFWYKKAIAADRNYYAPYFNVGIIYLEYDSLDKAQRYFDLATKMEPTFAMGYYYRGLTHQQRGDLTAAARDYEQALAFDPDLLRAQRALDGLGAQ